jgi:hypothetical protein
MMAKLSSKATVGAFALCGCFISADATLIDGRPNYSLWVNPLAVGAYATAAIGIVGMTCGIFIALSSPRRRIVLGDDHLRDIWRTSTDSGYTWARKKLMLKDYLGMRIRVSGTVVEVGERTGSPSGVTITTHVCDLTVFMSFSRKGRLNYPLSIFTLGAPVAAVGKIKQIGPNGILLVKCATCRSAE